MNYFFSKHLQTIKFMKKKGVTLLENLIALIILILVMGGLISVFISGRQNILRFRSKMTAAEMGRFFLEPLQIQVSEDNWVNTCLGSKNASICEGSDLFQPMDISGITYTPSYEISDAPGSTTLRKVKLTITWNDPS